MVETLRRQVPRMKSEPAGAHPTATETMLVDQVVGCWLAAKHAEGDAARGGSSSLGQAALRLKWVESAWKRYLAAPKMLTLLRASMPQGLAPLNSVKFHAGKARRA